MMYTMAMLVVNHKRIRCKDYKVGIYGKDHVI
jgi:hypothetical protein